ncbi:bifunctional UDP-N-acetylglucosamine diphosphorylase/glucosamine-1-phosphate N-acetyltransferase GlmU [Legionella gresilensis]|uniref:bifunctional UDP-N-acetylglucosamine diphosphorylase/glucosamine-1-phosphate N-acetyltransferase GlmU n=1 Tax=Legionella gresilensis TaxID=91823 RepID=UPI001041788E|nr:bifunctional UDP-N-acetylglucosamine diphosphorylase/glucosamine-1-phosphate N-acetyltransferase GlmU [Legionella gresilensis]
MSLEIIILAAGQGKRMYSAKPKVLHTLAGLPLLQHVITTAQQLKPAAIHIVYGHGGEQVKQELGNLEVNWILQDQQLGTGHAVKQALPHLSINSQVLILSGDVPLIQLHTLQKLVEIGYSSSNKPTNSLALLVANLPDPTGLGRIIRDHTGVIKEIIEEKDASLEQKQVNEIYTGICCIPAKDLERWLPLLNNNNAQKEYYLTEIISFAVQEGYSINSFTTEDNLEIQGVNTRLQLQQMERAWQQRQAEQLLLSGVMIADANRIDIRGKLICGRDVFIDVNCVFIGEVILGDDCSIGPNCVLANVTLGAGSEVLANSVLEECKIEEQCQIGPFARLRPGTQLGRQCKIGNFVEAKKAVFAEGSKASHLSYLGDVTLGKDVNIGAGTITCNYDGANKHQTIIEDGAFIGSDTQLVAPVTVGAYATVGAGSTIRKNVPAGELTICENRQKTILGWKRPIKKKE